MLGLTIALLSILVTMLVLLVSFRSIGRDWLRTRRIREPVRGEGYVVSASMPPSGALSANYQVTLVVRADGIPPTTVEHAGFALMKKWPQPGVTLPITVDRADPTRLRIEWGEVPTARQRGLDAADLFTKTMGGETMTPGSPFVSPGLVNTTTNTVTVNGHTLDASQHPGLQEEIQRLLAGGLGDPARLQSDIYTALQTHGIRLEQAGRSNDPAERMRRLDGLRRQGLIGETEYQEQRQRILGEL